VRDICAFARDDIRWRDLSASVIENALGAVIAELAVYRTYLLDAPSCEQDVRLLNDAMERAHKYHHQDPVVLDLLRHLLLDTAGVHRHHERRQRLVRRFQQLTGPVMAKGLEDTLFYTYGRFIAANEVGGDPSSLGITAKSFHRDVLARSDLYPHGLIATATHDTKRGEDTRGRLLALADEPQLLRDAWAIWSAAMNALELPEKPDKTDQYILLQNLLGFWPHNLDVSDAEAMSSLRERLTAFALKAAKEAKRRTSWTEPNEAYETGLRASIDRLLAPRGDTLVQLAPIVEKMSVMGMKIALVRTALKCCLPGVPDFYQGTESWDLALVDPDNRRPVDYTMLAEGLSEDIALPALLEDWTDGRVKQALIARLLSARQQNPDLFADGTYTPITTDGDVVAFQRHHGADTLIFAGLVRFDPRQTSNRVSAEEARRLATAIPPGQYRNLLTDHTFATRDDEGPLSMTGGLPVVVLRALT
jgi:(1->4)-alpha-D-glucan 1-alpha-D-glucosylmutase